MQCAKYFIGQPWAANQICYFAYKLAIGIRKALSRGGVFAVIVYILIIIIIVIIIYYYYYYYYLLLFFTLGRYVPEGV